MGFLDKAKKMAEQAQTKLDEVQKQFNESQGGSQGASAGGAGGDPIEYDQHGRPVSTGEPAAPPPPPPAPPAPPAAPEAATAPPPPAPTAPPAPPAPEPQQQRDDEYAAPKLTSGDPLEG
jgi:hypothetical protein